MEVHQLVVMEQVDKDEIVVDPGARNIGVWEVLDWHCVVVKLQGLVDIKLILLDFFFTPVLGSKCPDIEDTVVHVHNGKLGST